MVSSSIAWLDVECYLLSDLIWTLIRTLAYLCWHPQVESNLDNVTPHFSSAPCPASWIMLPYPRHSNTEITTAMHGKSHWTGLACWRSWAPMNDAPPFQKTELHQDISAHHRAGHVQRKADKLGGHFSHHQSRGTHTYKHSWPLALLSDEGPLNEKRCTKKTVTMKMVGLSLLNLSPIFWWVLIGWILGRSLS